MALTSENEAEHASQRGIARNDLSGRPSFRRHLDRGWLRVSAGHVGLRRWPDTHGPITDTVAGPLVLMINAFVVDQVVGSRSAIAGARQTSRGEASQQSGCTR